jgi:hypothetical protein
LSEVIFFHCKFIFLWLWYLLLKGILIINQDRLLVSLDLMLLVFFDLRLLVSLDLRLLVTWLVFWLVIVINYLLAMDILLDVMTLVLLLFFG